MKLKYAGSTHVGMKRSHNEDAFIIVPSECLYAVADGMGGHAGGEMASKIGVETISEFFRETAADNEITWPCRAESNLSENSNRLRASIKLANLRIYEKAQIETKYKGMGTTIVGAVFHDNKITVGHVGDSRMYRLRDNTLTLLTEDHSLLNDYKKMTHLTEEEERNFPHKNIILRALGMNESVEVDIAVEEPQVGDVYLLCSDGLSGEIEDDQMRDIIVDTNGDLELACKHLIKVACENGGKDNVTAVLVQVE